MHKSVTPGFARLAKVFGISLFVLAMAVGAYAQTQSTTGTIQGTVLDEQGGAVPGATVEIKNLATNATRTLTTDDEGRFVALALQSGAYSVTITKQGFAISEAPRVEVTVGQAVNLPVAMKVSGVEARVTISGTPTVDTVKTESSTTLNEKAVNNTPILGRKFEDLLTLTPGVSITQGPDGDEINFNGQRGVFNNVTLMAAITTMAFLESSSAANARPSMCLSMRLKNFRSWHPALPPSSAAPPVGLSMSSQSQEQTTFTEVPSIFCDTRI